MPNITASDSLSALTNSRSAQRRGLLINAVTDLFATGRRHNATERRQFEELISQLLVYASKQDKMFVATKLCKHPDAPERLIVELAREDIQIAEMLLLNAQQIDDEKLIEIARACGEAHQIAIARRKPLSVGVVTALIGMGEAACLRALILNEAAAFDNKAFGKALSAAEKDPELTKLLSHRADMNPRQMARKFVDLKTEERERVIVGFKAFPPAQESGETYLQLSETANDIVVSLEHLAMRKRIDTFAQVLATMIRLPREAIVKMIADESGEPLIVMLKAVGVQEKSTLRILLHINEKVGESVAAIYRLINIYRDMPQSTANAILRELRITARSSAAAPKKAPASDTPARGKGRQPSKESPSARTPTQRPAEKAPDTAKKAV